MTSPTSIRLLCRFVLILIGLSFAYLAVAEQRPHIVILVSDDQGWGDTGYDGHPTLPTPNLDTLAKNGVTLNRFYVSSPKCSPSRAGILTGRQSHRWNFLNGAGLNRREKTIANHLGEAGYVCGHFGKWQMGSVTAGTKAAPSSRGFHVQRSVRDAGNLQVDGVLHGEDGKEYPYKGDASVAIIRETLTFIQQAVDEGKPSLSLVWYGSPHGVVKGAAQEDYDALPPKAKPRTYLAKIHGIDRSIGILRAGLREMEIEDQTLVVFFSDNGYKGGHGGLQGGKETLWEGGIRLPGAAEWPGVIPSGTVSDVPVSGMDMVPTAVKLAEISEPQYVGPLDGIDILPILKSEQKERAEPIPVAYFGVNGLIMGDYKVTLGNPSAKPKKVLTLKQVLEKTEWHIYDLKNDPKETTNLAENPTPEHEALKQALKKWMQSAMTDSYFK